MTDSQSATPAEKPAPPKRKHERRSCRLKMRCRRARTASGGPATDKFTEGFVRNQSLGGLLLETPIYFPVGIQLEVGFKSPDEQQSFFGLVTIRWTQRVGNVWLLGVVNDRMDRF